MKPQSIGRVLGTGLRVAGRIAGQQIANNANASAANAAPAPSGSPAASTPRAQTAASFPTPAQTRSAGQTAGKATRGVARGLGGFLRPFGYVGGTIWLEVTGVFFALPVVVFVPTLWRTRYSWAHGPDHRTFLVAAIIVVLFSYLSVTSFLRARRR
jgi:hypothetical protein